MTMRAKKPDDAHKPRFIEKDVRPVEFIVRGGYTSLRNAAMFLDLHYITLYGWAVLRKRYPIGFPEAIRMGMEWRIAWNDLLKWKDGLRTYKEEKKLNLHRYNIKNASGKLVDYSKIFVTVPDDE